MKFKALNKYRFVFLFFAILVVIVSIWIYKNRLIFSKDIRNVLLISIDTCRADYLSCYGYSENTTPTIDALAKSGILFKNVVSPCPYTRPAHSSMLTGTIPPYHNVHRNEKSRLSDSLVTISEILKNQGFSTGAIVSSFILNAKFGMDQGFDYYNDQFEEEVTNHFIKQRAGEEASQLACDWLSKNKDNPFFLFLHYFDPHFPYNPPEPFKSTYANNLYAGEIAYTDHCIARVIKMLKDLDLYNSTLIVVIGDHGEDLNDHGEKEHGFFIYDTTIKVPLIIRAPGSTRGKRIQANSGLIDIMPTILGFLGIPVPLTVQGIDLRALISGDPDSSKDRPLFCETLKPTEYGCNPLLGLVSNNFKYIQTTRPELYDLKSDPGEKRNIVAEQPHRVRIMQDQLKQILKTSTRSADNDSKTLLDDKERARLESLGYIAAGTIDDSMEFDQSKNDAKDAIALHKKYRFIRQLVNSKKYTKAIQVAEKMLEKFPEFPVIYRFLGEIAHENNEAEKAIQYYKQYITFDPNNYIIYYNLGKVYATLSQFDAAEKNFSLALDLSPDDFDLYRDIGDLLKIQGKNDNAIRYYHKALSLDPDLIGAHAALGSIYQEQGKFAKAVDHYHQILKQMPDYNQAHQGLARIYLYSDKPDLAMKHYAEVLQTQSDDLEARLGLANALLDLGQRGQAFEQYKRVLETRPDNVIALNKGAWILATKKDAGAADSAEAVKLATRACELTGFRFPEQVDTLAAAFAAANDFTRAVRIAEKALQLAESANNIDLAEKIKNRVVRYQSNQPYYEPS